VADGCSHFPGVPIVLDPVLASSSGTPLIDVEGIEAMKELLFPKATVITPNVPEAAYLTGIDVRDENTAYLGAEKLLQFGCKHVVIKGGHLAGEPKDFLVNLQGRRTYQAERIDGMDIHGTGCMFSSALAALLGQGKSIGDAVARAKGMVVERIKKAIDI
jgi:hydroxymethylpyrimidine kinase/phosphomethylpyrimidine kinase